MVNRRPVTDEERPGLEHVCAFLEPTGLYSYDEVCDILDQVMTSCAGGDEDGRKLRSFAAMTIAEVDALLNGKPRYDPQNNPTDLARMLEIRAAKSTKSAQ